MLKDIISKKFKNFLKSKEKEKIFEEMRDELVIEVIDHKEKKDVLCKKK